ncbi:hypothetical protein ARMGADRAFT_908197, partial [Armillaria gallica]
TVQALQASIQALTLQVQTLSSRKNTAPRSDRSHTANNYCKGVRHILEECWKVGGGKQGQYPPWWKGKWDAPILSSTNLATAGMSSSKAGSIYTNSALMVNNASQGNVDTSLLYGDLGASTHFIQNKDCFFHYLPLGE